MKIWKRLWPDSLIKKCIYSVAGAAFLMLLLIWMMAQELMFQFLKPELQKNISVLTSGISTKVSYLLHQNSQYILQFWRDKELMEEAVTYASLCETEGEKAKKTEDCRENILQKLVGEALGETQPGAIVSKRNVFLVVDGTYRLVKDEWEPYARRVMQSQWFERLPDIFAELSLEGEEAGLERCYSPVFLEEPGMGEFISFAVPCQMDDHTIYLIMIEAFSDFRNIFSDFDQVDLNDYCLLGYQNEVLFRNRKDSFVDVITEKERGALRDVYQYAAKVTEIGPYTILVSKASYQMDQIHVAVALTQKDFLQSYQPFLRTVSLVFSMATVVLAVIVVLILRKRLNQLRDLSVQMESVQVGEYQIEKRISAQDEVGSVADSFYNMMEKIQKSMTRIEEQEKKEKRIEYSLLLSQIDPHFIYNTLNTITYLAGLNRTKDIVILNRALIGMLRDRLRMSQLQIFDTLEEEKAQIDSYMTIQSYLCSNRIQYTFYIPEDCRELVYPKNVLQPFVENSILHGILLNKDENGISIPGIVRLSVFKEGEGIVTEIEDNGIGMDGKALARYFEEPPERKMAGFDQQKDNGEHIGIYNIRMRLWYLYGDKFELETEQSELGGLKIRLMFPADVEDIIKQKEENFKQV